MSLMSSQFGLDDMEALFWGPSTLMADPLRSLLDPDDMMASPSEEAASSPLSSLSSPPSSSASPSPSSHFSSSPSPPSSPTPLLDDKVGEALMTLVWPPADHPAPSDAKEDAFSGMDWMAEPMDLTDFDLDSFITSCGPDDPPSSPEELLSSLDSLEAQLPLPLPSLTPTTVPMTTATAVSAATVTPVSIAAVPEVQAELEIKTEPPSPVPSPSVLPPPSPDITLELGSEVDVCDAKPITITTAPPAITAMTAVSPQQQVSRIVLSLSPTRIVLLLAPPKQEVGIAPPPSCAAAAVKMAAASSPSSTTKHYQASSSSTRTRPYPAPSQAPLSSRTTTRPKPGPNPVLVVPAAAAVVSSPPSSSSAAAQPAPVVSKARSRVMEKKQRKMEQNKTAATRYRQKKRVEQESLQSECSRLEERNQELAEKADSITKEIQYLKELMEEVRLAKQRKAQAQGSGGV